MKALLVVGLAVPAALAATHSSLVVALVLVAEALLRLSDRSA